MRSLIFACLLLSQPLMAALFSPMNGIHPLSCEFSLEHHNRIFIEEGKIKKIIYPEEKLAVRLEETSGQAFIQARQAHVDTVLLTVISSEGAVQDVEITFKSVPSQVVALRAPLESLPDRYSNYVEESPPLITCDPSTLVTQILRGETPEGYRSILTPQSSWKIRSGVEATLIGCLEGSGENLFLYRLHNARLWSKCVSEKNFSCASPSWVYVQENKIPPKQTTLAIVAVPS